MRHTVGTALVAGLLALTGCTDEEPETVAEGADPGVPPLSEAQVRLFLRDTTLAFATEERLRFLYLAEDGGMAGLTVDPATDATERARGVWRVTPEGLLCRSWTPPWPRGGDGCAAVYRYGDTYLFVHESGSADGDVEYRGSREPGNTRGL